MSEIPTYPETVRVVTRFRFYRPGGFPLYWMDEQTGVLPAAVKAYFEDTLTAEQLDLLLDYLRYVICAECWNEPAREARDRGDQEPAATLIRLRLDLVEGRVKTVPEIHAWMERCLEFGIDPL